jgi:hypothetical protein
VGMEGKGERVRSVVDLMFRDFVLKKKREVGARVYGGARE